MTSGAIYGNFKNRDELFVTLGQTYWPPIKPKIRRDRASGKRCAPWPTRPSAAVPDRRAVAVGRLTGMAYTLTEKNCAPRCWLSRPRAMPGAPPGCAAWPRTATCPCRPNALVVVIHTLTEGLLFQRFMTPELVPDEVIYAAFDALAR